MNILLRPLLILILLAHTLRGVSQDAPKAWVKLQPAFLTYKGDYSQLGQNAGTAFQAEAWWHPEKRLGAVAGILLGSISADTYVDPTVFNGDIQPAAYFKTSFLWAGAGVRFFVLTKSWGKLYVSQSAGLMRYTPKDADGNKLANQLNTRAPQEEYGNTTLSLPSRVGVILNWPKPYALGIDAQILNPLTDYLDNTSMLGNPDNNDQILSLGISFYIPYFRSTSSSN